MISSVIMPRMDLILENLKTGKPHVSFSEVSCWKECSWRHKLQHVDKLGEFKYAPALAFGTVQHSAIEQLIETGNVNIDEFCTKLAEQWEKHQFEKDMPLSLAQEQLRNITSEFKPFMDQTFPDWKHVASEYPLYEAIDNTPHAFKGFIDLIIEAPGKKNKKLYWIIDLKTTQWGWDRDKKSDEITRYQLIYYKNFWGRKLNVEPKDIRCAFILLKKRGKPGNFCESVPVSVGDVTTGRAIKTLHNMISSVNKGIALKNRNACKWCEFKGTSYCP